MKKIIAIALIMLLAASTAYAAPVHSDTFGETISFYAKIYEKNPREIGRTFGEIVELQKGN